MVQTSQAHTDATELLLKLGIVSHHVNAFLFHADNTHYHHAVAVRQRAINQIASQKSLCAIDPLIYEGREILFNRVSGVHTDSQDPPFSWAILAAFGNNSPVELSLPQLNLRMAFKPGDMIAIRGHVVKHGTSSWSAGQRIVIPHFTHASTWTSMQNKTVFSMCNTS